MLRLIVVCTAICALLSGCGAGYSIEPARLVLTNANNLSISELRSVIGPLLQKEMFDDLGLDEGMIALQSRSGRNEATDNWLLARFQNQYTYLSEQRNLRIVVSDYTDVALRRPTLPYEEPEGPFFEISIYEERPGGFSTSGNKFLAGFQLNLESSLNVPVTLAIPPPATNDREYWRISTTNFVALVVSWFAVFGLSLAIIGSVSVYIIKKLSLSVRMKRGIFVLANTWLVAPLPFPAATIFVIVMPNVVAFPWTSIEYYQRVADVAVVSFSITLTLCTLISIKIFKQHDAREGCA